MNNIWERLPRPFFVLAPMDDVTDTVFRQVVADLGAPDLFFTEFASADGLQSPGRQAVEQKLRFSEAERPLIAQIWGKDPISHYKTARELTERGFDGIDLNFGCPVANVVKNGCCAALINNQALAHELIMATKEGAANLPVSVKTRIGFNTIATEEWCGWLLENHQLAALSVHARTAAEKSKVPARHQELNRVVALKDRHSPATAIIANGDILSRAAGEECARQTGVDGVMIGRGIFKDPWLFSGAPAVRSRAEHLEVLERHVRLFDETWGGVKPFVVMKKFFKIYVSGWPGAAELRAELMDCNTAGQVFKVLQRQQAGLAKG